IDGVTRTARDSSTALATMASSRSSEVKEATPQPPPAARARTKPPWSSLAVADSRDRKSTRLNSSHLVISYAVFCLKKKNKHSQTTVTPCSHSVLLLSSASSPTSLSPLLLFSVL